MCIIKLNRHMKSTTDTQFVAFVLNYRLYRFRYR
uniref:Uncharacterized protein n=1 Tax=Anguilla anguilla TaxID=7936 RepID=A0A0E9TZ63_ANGAN